jgi:hypothetical protein
MIRRALTSLSFWFAVVLLVANGAMWSNALAPQGPAVSVDPVLAPDIASLRQQLVEGGHSGEPFTLVVTNQEAAETIAWYLGRHPGIPFGEPQVFIAPGGIEARGVAEIAGLRVRLTGEAHIALRDGVPIVTLGHLDIGGVAVPGFIRDRIQQEIDAQFALSRDLPLVVDELLLQEGKAILRGRIR